MLALTLCVSACATAHSDAVCPPWPVAGAAVAAELEGLAPGAYPALWAWIERLARLRDQLAACRHG
ncbi:MAG: hypothetical protein OHK0024_36770 [Thalassobaculales bacterium]